MRRKNTRASTKASPEKPKEEKAAKRPRRHSKRHKPTSSESESDDEVSISSTDNGTKQTEKELWTVTQTEPSSNDIGKIKICLARPTPVTPERPERASKRLSGLRSKPALMELGDSPAASPTLSDDNKPTRRSRRRGASSPVKKEDAPQLHVQQDTESGEEKKGKGKSKGKHKSKIVEQTAHDDEHTEMQREISANVQVTAQSPQNVDKSDADETIVDREDARCSIISSESKPVDKNETESDNIDNENNQEQDTNDNVLSVNTDLSNNNVANENLVPEADVQAEVEAEIKAEAVKQVENVEENAGDGTFDESCNKTIEEIEPETPEVSDISMREVTHFEIDVSKDEGNETEPETKELVEKEDGESVKEEIPEVKEDIKQEELQETVKNEEKTEEVETVKEELKIEEKEESKLVKPEKVEKREKIEEIKEEKRLKIEKLPKVMETSEKTREKSLEPEEKQLKTPEPEKGTIDEGEETKEQKDEEPESKSEPEDEPQVEENKETSSKEEIEESFSPKEEVTWQRRKLKLFQRSTSTISNSSRNSSEKDKADIWGEPSQTIPDLLLILSSKLVEMYPTAVLLDEDSVKLESTPRERVRGRNRIVKERPEKPERRVSVSIHVEEKEVTPAPPPVIENSLALHRKISIVEDEAKSLRPPPSPAKHDKSSVLFITNLVRPFTAKQLRGLLERTGKIIDEGFWTDKIKSKCYVHYETDEEAEATRNALHGVLWPVGNGKKLIIDYSTPEDLELARNPPIVVPPPPPVVETGKENQEPVKKTLNDTELPELPPQWDGKSRRSTSGQREHIGVEKRRHSQSRRSRSPSEDLKKKLKREEPVQQRAMDDLFRKTEATPSIYWQALSPEEIALKQQQRLERMEAHKRKMETQTRTRRNSERGARGGPYRRRY